MSDSTAGGDSLFYHRCRFETRLPTDRLYTASHNWLREVEPGVWQIGLTAYGTRLLGEIVEFDFTVKPGAAIEADQPIGWVEGFKTLSDLISAASGEFVGENAALRGDITLLDRDPYGQGWLYQVRGTRDATASGVDAREYVLLLNAAIDVILGADADDDPDA
jgi:glycine cleavage system H protein